MMIWATVMMIMMITITQLYSWESTMIQLRRQVVDIRSKVSHPCTCLQLLDDTSSLILPGCTAVSGLQLSDCMFALASIYRFLERQLPDIGALLVRQIRQAIDVPCVGCTTLYAPFVTLLAFRNSVAWQYNYISERRCHPRQQSPKAALASYLGVYWPTLRLFCHCKRQLSDIKA